MKKRITAIFTALSLLLTAFAFSGCSENIRTVSYIEAEQALVSSMVSEYAKLVNFVDEYNAGTLDMSKYGGDRGAATLTITPESGLASLLGGSTLNPTVLEVTSVAESVHELFANFIYKNGTKELLNVDYWLSGDMLILLVPQLFDKYFFADFAKLSSDMQSAVTNAMKSGITTLPTMPSEAAVQSVIGVALSAYKSYIEGIEAEETTLDIMGKGESITVAKTDIVLTEEMLIKIALETLKAVRANSEIMTFIDECVGMLDVYGYAESSYTMLTEAIEDLEWELENSDNDTVFNMTAYVSGKNIVQRVISFNDGWDDYVITLTTYDNGSEYNYSLEFSETATEQRSWGSDTSWTLSNIGVKNKKSCTGAVTFSMDSYTSFSIVADYTQLEIGKDGMPVSGELSVNLEVMMVGVSLDVTFANGSFAAVVNALGQKFVSIDAEWSNKAEGKPVPELNSSNSINMIEVDDAPDGFEENLEKWMENLADADGNLDLIGMLIQMAGSGGFNPFGGSRVDWDDWNNNECYYCGDENCNYDCDEARTCYYCEELDCNYQCDEARRCFYCEELDCNYECDEARACYYCKKVDCNYECDEARTCWNCDTLDCDSSCFGASAAQGNR